MFLWAQGFPDTAEQTIMINPSVCHRPKCTVQVNKRLIDQHLYDLTSMQIQNLFYSFSFFKLSTNVSFTIFSLTDRKEKKMWGLCKCVFRISSWVSRQIVESYLLFFHIERKLCSLSKHVCAGEEAARRIPVPGVMTLQYADPQHKCV